MKSKTKITSLLIAAIGLALISCANHQNATPPAKSNEAAGVNGSQALTAAEVSSRTSTDPVGGFLKNHPMMRLLDSNDVRVRLEVLSDSVAAAVVKGDTNGDNYDDIVAVFVDRSLGARNSSVGVFRGGSVGYSATPIWVVSNSSDSIAGVAILKKPGVALIVCDGCDDLPVYYWSGEGYESGIRLPGDDVCIISGSPIHAEQDTTSPIVFKVSDTFGYVKILQLGQKTEKGTRWHKVQLTSSNGETMKPEISGFVDSSWFFLDIGC